MMHKLFQGVENILCLHIYNILQYQCSSAEAECPCKKIQVPRERPYKVCGGKNRDRKGIVAASFKDLIVKARQKFSVDEIGSEEITLVLFEDRTEIGNTYLNCQTQSIVTLLSQMMRNTFKVCQTTRYF